MKQRVHLQESRIVKTTCLLLFMSLKLAQRLGLARAWTVDLWVPSVLFFIYLFFWYQDIDRQFSNGPLGWGHCGSGMFQHILLMLFKTGILGVGGWLLGTLWCSWIQEMLLLLEVVWSVTVFWWIVSSITPTIIVRIPVECCIPEVWSTVMVFDVAAGLCLLSTTGMGNLNNGRGLTFLLTLPKGQLAIHT